MQYQAVQGLLPTARKTRHVMITPLMITEFTLRSKSFRNHDDTSLYATGRQT